VVVGTVSPDVIEPDPPTRARLVARATSVRVSVRDALRARIVLAAADGYPNTQIAARVGTSVNTVRKWRHRFAVAGLAGLADAPRSGRPRVYGPQVRLAIVATATGTPPAVESTWSHRAIAGHLPEPVRGISASQVGRILADLDLKPHRIRGWLTRRADPRFYARATDICSLYRNPPPGAVVLSLDEKTAMQARSRRHPGTPPAPGRPARQEFEYVRHGTASIMAALEVRTGEVLCRDITRNNAATFTAFLNFLDQHIDPALPIHAVLDNGSSHTAKLTKTWLAAHPRWTVHWTPPHASWLNMVELFFSILTRRVLRHGDFPSRDDLINKITNFIIDYNDTAKPYRWTYDGTPLKTA
jgi:transposase